MAERRRVASHGPPVETAAFPEDAPEIVKEALSGTPKARRRHAKQTATPASVEAGLSAIARRWPSLASPHTSEPIFILSAGWRCGSTFLQRWLMKGNDLLIWGEPYRYSEPIHLLARQVCAFAKEDWPFDSFFADRYPDQTDLTNEFVANLYPSMERVPWCSPRLLRTAVRRACGTIQQSPVGFEGSLSHDRRGVLPEVAVSERTIPLPLSESLSRLPFVPAMARLVSIVA